jgi:glyoxylase I family protein
MTGKYRTAAVSFACAACLMVVTTLGTLALSQGNKDKPQRLVRVERNTAPGNRVRMEHLGLNVADPIKIAQWYVDNLSMKVLREGAAPTNNRFVGDAGGNMMLELYHNAAAAVPDYAALDPQQLHVAFFVDDVEAVRGKLLAAGAKAVDEVTTTPAGDKLAMLRDPWGLPIQFVHRANPMLPAK